MSSTLCFHFDNKCVFPTNNQDLKVENLEDEERISYISEAISITVEPKFNVKVVVNGETVVSPDGRQKWYSVNRYNGKYFWITIDGQACRCLIRFDVQTETPGAMKTIPYPFEGCLSQPINDELYAFDSNQHLWKIDANMEVTDLGEKDWDYSVAFNGKPLFPLVKDGYVKLQDLDGNDVITIPDTDQDVNVDQFGDFLIVNNRFFNSEYQECFLPIVGVDSVTCPASNNPQYIAALSGTTGYIINTNLEIVHQFDADPTVDYVYISYGFDYSD